MKRKIIIAVIIIVALIIMDLLVKFISKSNPNIHEKIVNLTYSNIEFSKKVGKLQSYTITYNPLNLAKDTFSFEIIIQGDKNYVQYKGKTTKKQSQWVIINPVFRFLGR